MERHEHGAPELGERNTECFVGLRVASEVMSGPASTPGHAAGISDEVLIVGVAWRQVGALGEIYRRYSSAVYSLAVGVVRDRTVAEELTQEVFLGLWAEPSSFSCSAPGRLHTRLCADCVERAADRLRDNDARSEDSAGPPRGAADERVQRVSVAVPRQSPVDRALQEIPVDERTAILVTYVARLTYRETAALLGYSQMSEAERHAHAELIADRIRDALVA